jgi:hypothetical protein
MPIWSHKNQNQQAISFNRSYAWRASEQDPMYMTNYYAPTTEVSYVTLISYQISARSWSNAHLFTLLKRVHQPQTIKSGLNLCWKSGTHATVEQDTINRCKHVENHMCIAPARIRSLSSFNNLVCSPLAWETHCPVPLGSVTYRAM